jgi:integrase
MNQQKLTKSLIDRTALTVSGQKIVRDSELQGFGIRVGVTAKTYFVEKRVDGRGVRTTIGRHGQITCEQARKRAQELLGQMTMGINPNHEQKKAKARSKTLFTVQDAYLARPKALKPRTIDQYRQVTESAFSDWLNRPLAEITNDMVLERHAMLGEEHGPAFANLAMRILRAIFNFAMARYGNTGDAPTINTNPVSSLSQTRSWFRVDRRQTFIPKAHRGDWLRAIWALPDNAKSSRERLARETARDYLLILLFTGLRKNEAATLRWQAVDLKARTLTITDTKNGDPLTLPLSDYVFNILARRKTATGVGYVFPSSKGHGPLVDARKHLRRVADQCGVEVCPHDLRRTFTTVAESLDLSRYAVKRLLNHRCDGDVTEGYVVHDVERLREPMQRVATALLACAEPSETVASLPA